METENLNILKLIGIKAKEDFKTGFYNIHPDIGLNYQMNRFFDGSKQMLNEMREVTSRGHN
jgi:hypothetical protein